MVETTTEPRNGSAAAAGTTTGSERVMPSRLIEHVDVEVEAVLGNCSLKVADLLAMEKGEVIALDRQINEAVELRVNGKVIARGEIVTVEDKFAVRIASIG